VASPGPALVLFPFRKNTAGENSMAGDYTTPFFFSSAVVPTQELERVKKR